MDEAEYENLATFKALLRHSPVCKAYFRKRSAALAAPEFDRIATAVRTQTERKAFAAGREEVLRDFRLLATCNGSTSHILKALEHDVSGEARDQDGKWTTGGKTGKRAGSPLTAEHVTKYRQKAEWHRANARESHASVPGLVEQVRAAWPEAGAHLDKLLARHGKGYDFTSEAGSLLYSLPHDHPLGTGGPVGKLYAAAHGRVSEMVEAQAADAKADRIERKVRRASPAGQAKLVAKREREAKRAANAARAEADAARLVALSDTALTDIPADADPVVDAFGYALHFADAARPDRLEELRAAAARVTGQLRGVEGQEAVYARAKEAWQLATRLLTVSKAMDAGPDPHAAVAVAMVDALIADKEKDEASTGGPVYHYLAGLLHDPGALSDALKESGGGVEHKALALAVGTVILKAHHGYKEELHPRNKEGRWISKDQLHQAKSDPALAAKLRDEVRPSDAGKLEKVLSGETEASPTKRGEQRQQAAQRQQTKADRLERVKQIRLKVGTLSHTLGDIQELAEHLPHLTVDELRKTRLALQSHGAGFGGARTREKMAAALLAHATRIADEMDWEDRSPSSIRPLNMTGGAASPDDFDREREESAEEKHERMSGWLQDKPHDEAARGATAAARARLDAAKLPDVGPVAPGGWDEGQPVAAGTLGGETHVGTLSEIDNGTAIIEKPDGTTHATPVEALREPTAEEAAKVEKPATLKVHGWDSGVAPIPATAPGVTHDDIPGDIAYAAHANSSFSPDKRAAQDQNGYVEQMNADWEHLSQFATTPEQMEQLKGEFERYRQGYREKTIAALHAASRTASSMITGPANFPVERNRKRMETERKRIDELIDFRKRALAAVRKKFAPAEGGPVKSNDPGAVDALQKQLDAAQQKQERMKLANGIVRQHVKFTPGKFEAGAYTPNKTEYKPGKTRDDLVAALVGAGVPEADAHSLATPNEVGQLGHQAYELTNNNANIGRLQGRIKELSEMHAGGHKEEQYTGGVKVVEDPDAARIRVHFPGKPDAATIGKLKSAGFRWSPSEGAWQRHLNNGGRYAVSSTLAQLGHTKVEKPAADTAGDDVPPMIAPPEPEPDLPDSPPPSPHPLTLGGMAAAQSAERARSAPAYTPTDSAGHARMLAGYHSGVDRLPTTQAIKDDLKRQLSNAPVGHRARLMAEFARKYGVDKVAPAAAPAPEEQKPAVKAPHEMNPDEHRAHFLRENGLQDTPYHRDAADREHRRAIESHHNSDPEVQTRRARGAAAVVEDWQVPKRLYNAAPRVTGRGVNEDKDEHAAKAERAKLLDSAKARRIEHLTGLGLRGIKKLAAQEGVDAEAAQKGTTMFPLHAIAHAIDHKQQVKAALAAGKPVPPEVLADYPDLAPKTQPAAARVTAEPEAKPPRSDAKTAEDPPRMVNTGETPAQKRERVGAARERARAETNRQRAKKYGPKTGHPATDAALVEHRVAGGKTREALAAALHNIGVEDPHSPPKGHAPDPALVLRRFASAHRELAEGGHDTSPLDRVLAAHGARPVGTPGEEVAFDGGIHDGPTGVFTGDRVRVVHPGFEMDRQGGLAPYTPLKAKVIPA